MLEVQELATEVVCDHFGPLCAEVVRALLTRPRQPLRQLLRTTKLGQAVLRNCLVSLMQHDCVHGTTSETGDVLYVADVRLCMFRALLPHFASVVHSALGDRASMLFEYVLQFGKAPQDEAIAFVEKKTAGKGATVESSRAELEAAWKQLIEEGFIERATDALRLPYGRIASISSHLGDDPQTHASLLKVLTDAAQGAPSKMSAVYAAAAAPAAASSADASGPARTPKRTMAARAAAADAAASPGGAGQRGKRVKSAPGAAASASASAGAATPASTTGGRRGAAGAGAAAASATAEAALPAAGAADSVPGTFTVFRIGWTSLLAARKADFVAHCFEIELVAQQVSVLRQLVFLSERSPKHVVMLAQLQAASMRTLGTPVDIPVVLAGLRERLGMEIHLESESVMCNAGKLIRLCIADMLDRNVQERFGSIGHAVFRMLAGRGPCTGFMDQKMVATNALITERDAREKLYELLKAGLVYTQEIGKTGENVLARSVLLWGTDDDSAALAAFTHAVKTARHLSCRLKDLRDMPKNAKSLTLLTHSYLGMLSFMEPLALY